MSSTWLNHQSTKELDVRSVSGKYIMHAAHAASHPEPFYDDDDVDDDVDDDDDE